jgi:hypothetical protein|nr:MAG TPA: hypothetical protein [Caudoviricetes sp.]
MVGMVLLVGRYCLLVWGDAKETKGERGAVVAWGRPRWSSVPCSPLALV